MCFWVTDAIANIGSSLPAVDSSNNGGVLKVINGAWAIGYAQTSETLTSVIQVTHSFASRKSTMSISSVPFQPSHPWVRCYSSISLNNSASYQYASYTCNSYGQKTPGANLLIVGAYCRPGQDTSWTYKTWYLNLSSDGKSLSWVTAGSNTADNHGDSGSYNWQFNLSVTGYFE